MRILIFLLLNLATLVLATPLFADELPTEPILRIEAGMHTSSVNGVDTDRQGRWAVTVSNDKTARVWDVANGKLLRVLRPPIGMENEGRLQAVALSPDGNTVVLGGQTGYAWNGIHQLYVFDRASGQLLRRLPDIPSSILKLAFSPDGRWLVATLWGRYGIRVWDWRRGGIPFMDADYGRDSYGASWSKDNVLVTTSLDGMIRTYQASDRGLKKLEVKSAPGGLFPYGVAFSPDGKSFILGYGDIPRVEILDTVSLNLRYALNTSLVPADISLNQVAWSADGNNLYAAGLWRINGRRQIRIWPAEPDGLPQDIPSDLENTVTALKSLPQNGLLVAGADPAWGVLNEDRLWKKTGIPPSFDFRGNRNGRSFLVNHDGSAVQFDSGLGGSKSYRIDLKQRVMSAGLLAGGRAPQNGKMDVTDWANSRNPKLAGQSLQLAPYEMTRCLAFRSEVPGFILGAEWSLNYFDPSGKPLWRNNVPGPTWGVNIPPAGKVVVAAYGDGTIRWHRLSDGKELLAFFPHADQKRWVLWTPDGYYDASPGGEDLIGWHVNRGQNHAADFFLAARFRGRFYRPDIIDQVLGTFGDETENRFSVPERKTVSSVSMVQVLPPVIDLVSPTEMQSSQTTVAIRYKTRSSADAPVIAVRARVNGLAQDSTRALVRTAADGSREISVTIPDRDSVIQLFAQNRHGVSMPATVQVKWVGANAVEVPKPKLYVLAVGVSQYQHPEISSLAFPAKDANDFVAVLKQQNKLYRAVEVKLLTEGQATRGNILEGLDWLQKNVGQHDVGMVFVAGHGVNDAIQGYTFLTADANPDDIKSTGVSLVDVRSKLAHFTGKVVFFLDTCHAGNALGAKRNVVFNDATGVVNELSSAENGVVVFSSSTGRQYSLEDPAWGNGAFTKALIEGLQGKADYQNSGRITFKMLDLYVSERVRQMTGGRQLPVTQAPGGVPDFPLAMVM